MPNKSEEYEGHWLLGIALIFLIAIAPLPYEYYMLLRVISVPIFGYLFYHAVNKVPVEFLGIKFSWVFVGFGLLYNPFIPVHLTKDIWMVFNLVTAVAIVTYWYAYNNLPSNEFSSSNLSSQAPTGSKALGFTQNQTPENGLQKGVVTKPNSSIDRETEFIQFMIDLARDYQGQSLDQVRQLLQSQKISYYDETESISVFPSKEKPLQVIFSTDKFKDETSMTIFCAEEYVGIIIHVRGKEVSSWFGSLEAQPMSGMGPLAERLFTKLINEYGFRDMNSF